MILKPLSGFSTNGVLRGNIGAFDDEGEPLGWEAVGNWSDAKFRTSSAKDLAETTDITQDKARTMIKTALVSARNAVGDDAQDSGYLVPSHDRPIIKVTARYDRDIAKDSWAALIASGNGRPKFFNYANSVAEIVSSGPGNQVHPRILSVAALRGHLNEAADYVRYKDNQETPARPPKEVLETMVAGASPPLPRLHWVSSAPIVSDKGEIVAKDGFDEASGLYVDLSGTDIPPIPTKPTTSNLAEAKEIIRGELLGDFPFATEGDATNAVAAMLNPIVRPMIDGPTPLHLVEASSPGSGKGLLCDVMAIASTGRRSQSMTEGNSEEEWRKRITASLVMAAPITLIDNVRKRLSAAALASVLTQDVWADRILGSSKIVTLPVKTTWYATGNNPALSDELARRCVRIRLTPDEEKPWERSQFRHASLADWAFAHRGELSWALLTMVRAWLVANRPISQRVMGSYERWVQVVGGILEHLGFEDFLSGADELYADAEREGIQWQSFMDDWWGSYGDQRVDVTKLLDLARQREELIELRSGRSERSIRTKMGLFLSRMRDRRFGQYIIRRPGVSEDTRASSYRLEMVPEAAE